MSDLFRLSTRWRDNLGGIATHLNTPQSRSVIVCYRHVGAPNTYLELIPRPLVDVVNPKMVAIYGQNIHVQIELDDIQLTGISVQYSAEQILGSHYVIDGKLVNDIVDGSAIASVEGGFEAERIAGSGLIRKPLTYELLLRRKPIR